MKEAIIDEVESKMYCNFNENNKELEMIFDNYVNYLWKHLNKITIWIRFKENNFFNRIPNPKCNFIWEVMWIMMNN